MKEGNMSQPRSEAEKELIAGYVLGDLSAKESQQFEQLLQQQPDLRAEVNAMQTSLRLMPHALPKVAPPPQLLNKVLAANAKVLAANIDPLPSASLPSKVEVQRSRPWSTLIAGIALLAALLLGADNFWLRRQLSIAQRTNPEPVASILQKPNSRLIALKGEGNSSAAGTLLFTPGQWQEVIISLGNLPPLPPEQIYRMWLTLQNGETLLCGEFNTNPQGQVFIQLNPSKTPPKGVKATGIFVTINSTTTPPTATGQKVMVGTL
jgi:Anti-sigma-K factor rskA